MIFSRQICIEKLVAVQLLPCKNCFPQWPMQIDFYGKTLRIYIHKQKKWPGFEFMQQVVAQIL